MLLVFDFLCQFARTLGQIEVGTGDVSEFFAGVLAKAVDEPRIDPVGK